MVLADELGKAHVRRRKGEARARIALAEGADALHEVKQLVRHARERQRAVDGEIGAVARLAHARCQPGLEKLLHGGELRALNREAGRHRVAAALDEMARGHGFAHGRADVGAGDGAQRAGAAARSALRRPRR